MSPKDVSHTIDIGNGKTVTVLKPVIDHVSMTMSGNKAITVMANAQGAPQWKALANDYWEQFYIGLVDALKSDDTIVSKESNHNQLYRIAASLKISNEHDIKLFANPKNTALNPIKLSFNPSKFKFDFTKKLEQSWQDIEFDNIPFPALMTDARVTRLDIAIDCIGMNPTDFIVHNNNVWKTWTAGHPKTGSETMQFYVKTGNQNSPQQSPKKRADLVIYDKRREQIANEIEPVHGDQLHTRIEFSLRKNCGLVELLKLSYPFGKWGIHRAVVKHPPYEEWLWTLILDSARYRGLEAAYSLVPKSMSNDVQLSKGEHAPGDIVNKEKTWQHWKHAIASAHLHQLCYWASEDIVKLMPNYTIANPDSCN